MKNLHSIPGAVLLLVLLFGPQGEAQVSRAFPDGVLLPNSQNRPALVATANAAAVIVPFPSSSALVHERSGGIWSLTQTMPGNFSAAAMNSAGTQFALARAGQIDLYSLSSPGNWLNFGNAYITDGSSVSKLAFEGDRLVALINTPYSITPGGTLLRVFEYNAISWEMVKEITILSTAEIIQVGRESVVTDFSLYGTDIAVSSQPEGCIRIHGRNQGGAGQWGQVRQITTTTAGVSALGQNVALHGDRLAAATASGTNRRIDVFSRNQGGADQWGFAGTLATAPVSEINTHLLSADAASGRLAALGIPNFSIATGSLTAPARLRAFEFTSGSGIGNWTPAADLPIGSVNGYGFFLPGLGFAGDDLIHGLGPVDPTGLAASWLASVHRRNTGGANAWRLQQTIAGPGSSSNLGRSIAISGQYVAVGMPNDTTAGLDTGCVMVWYQMKITGGSSWLPIGRVQASVPVAAARFGSSVAVFSTIDNTWLAVGAPGENSGRGAVYLFDLNSFIFDTTPLRIVPTSPVLNPADGFGSSVAFSENFHLAVGSSGDDAAGSNAGAAYVFEKDLGGAGLWGQRKKLNRPAGETNTGFASSLAFGNDHLAVALPPLASASGKLFLFTKNTGGTDNWGQSAVQSAPAGCPPGFGSSLASNPSYNLFVAGAPGTGADDKANIPEVPGKAYFFAANSDGTSMTSFAEFGGTAAEKFGFGTTVATDYSRVVVGNPNFGPGGKTFTYDLPTPSVFSFSLLHTREGSTGDGLGSAVAASKIFTFSTKPWSDLAGTDAGAVTIDRSGSYEFWAANQGPAFTQWFPDQDQDGDGLGNLIEFALGGNPLSASSRPPFAMTYTTFTNSTTSWPAMEWSPPSLAYDHQFLNYQIQKSADLGTWQNTSPAGGLGIGDPPGRYYRLTDPRGFFRLHALYPYTFSETLLIFE